MPQKRDVWTYDFKVGNKIVHSGFTSDPDFRNVVTQQPRGGQRPGAGGAGVLPGQ